MPLAAGKKNSVRAVPAEEIFVFCRRDKELTAVAELPHFVFAPLTQGEKAGRLIIYLDGNAVGECDLIYDESAALFDFTDALKRWSEADE